MRCRTFVVLVAIGAATALSCGEPPPPPADVVAPPVADLSTADPKTPFVGSWELVRVERISAEGEPLPPPEPPGFGSEGAVGYLMYDSIGYMGVVIMQAGRQPFASDEPTPGSPTHSRWR